MTAIVLNIAGPDLPGEDVRKSRGTQGRSQISILNGHGTNWRTCSSGGAFSIKWAPRGAIRYRVDGGSHMVRPDGLMLLNDGQPYEMDFQGAGQSFCLFYSRDLVDEAAGGPLGEFPNLVFRPGFGAALRILHDEIGAEGRWPDDIEARLLLVLGEAVAAARDHRREVARLPAIKPATRRHLRARLEVARALIAEGEGDNLDQVARGSGLSKFHLVRLFRQAFGTTPMRYAEGLRLDRAADRLGRSGALVEEIAFEAGYESLSSFGRAFRRRFGASPTAWRKAARN